MSRHSVFAGIALAALLCLAACGTPGSAATTSQTPASTATALPQRSTAEPTAAPTFAPTAASEPTAEAAFASRENMPFVFVDGIATTHDGTVYVSGARMIQGEPSVELWGFSRTSGNITFEGDAAVFANPIRSYGGIAAAPEQGLSMLDAANRAVVKADPASKRPGQMLDVEVWKLADASLPDDAAFHGIAASNIGDVYVLETTHGQVVHVDRRGHVVKTWGVPHVEGEATSSPSAIAVSGDRVYVANNTTVQQFDLQGQLQHSWRLPDAAACAGSEPETAHQGIGGLAIGASGLVYVSDEGCTPAHSGAQVVVFDRDGRQQAAWPVEPRTYPESIAVDADGYVYVVTQIIHGGRPSSVLLFDSAGHQRARWQGTESS